MVNENDVVSIEEIQDAVIGDNDNLSAQVANLCHTTIVQEAWARNQELSVHGWIYGLSDGLINDLGLCVSAPDQLSEIYRVT